jgi:hypothetical protein
MLSDPAEHRASCNCCTRSADPMAAISNPPSGRAASLSRRGGCLVSTSLFEIHHSLFIVRPSITNQPTGKSVTLESSQEPGVRSEPEGKLTPMGLRTFSAFIWLPEVVESLARIRLSSYFLLLTSCSWLLALGSLLLTSNSRLRPSHSPVYCHLLYSLAPARLLASGSS